MDNRADIERAIAALESQREVLGAEVVETALASLREKLVRQEAGSAREQRKLLTVLFADVSGFTALSERMDPEEVRELMNGLWERIDAVIARHLGTVDKHIGDAVMALFGVPMARDDDAERAVMAALEMQSSVACFSKEVASRFDVELSMRVGIHTGLAIAGTVGSRGEYTVIGDTVNLASRLEQAAPVGGVLVSEDTWRHLRGGFDATAPCLISLKGKAEPVRVYEVSRRSAHVGRLGRVFAGVETPLIGREATLAALAEVLERMLTKGQHQRVVLTGEPGVGKSRLLFAFCDSIIETRKESLDVLRVRPSHEASGAAYGLVRDLFFTRFGIRESDGIAHMRDLLTAGTQRLLGDRADDLLPFIAHLLGIADAADPRVLPLVDDGVQLRRRSFRATTELIREMALKKPLLLAIDDLHRADSGSLAFLDYLLSQEAFPLLVVATSRPIPMEPPASPDCGQPLTTLPIEPLDPKVTGELVDLILHHCQQVPDTLRKRLIEASGGNPFFLEELVQMLIDVGAIRPGPDGWSVDASRIGDMRVPSTLAAVVQERLEALPEDERLVLQRAAVVGRVFWVESLRYVGEGSDPEEALGSLVSRDLLSPASQSLFEGCSQYVFRNAIVQEVSYESILLRDRRSYHGRAARWLKVRAAGNLEAFALRIAEHWEKADQSMRAAGWYGRAARKSQSAYLLEAAIAYDRKALALADDGYLRFRLVVLERLAQSLFQHGDYTATLEVLDEVDELSHRLSATTSLARAAARRASLLFRLGRYEETAKAAEEASRLAEEARDDVLRARSLMLQGWVALRFGSAQRARTLGESALALCDEVKQGAERARALRFLGGVLIALGDRRGATRMGKEALALCRELDNEMGQINALNHLGETLRVAGEYGDAVDYYREALILCRRVATRGGLMLALSNLGGALTGLGDAAEAHRVLEEALSLAPQGWHVLPETLRFLAEAHLQAGRLDDALKEARASVEEGLAGGAPEFLGPAWRVLGQVLSAAGRPALVDDRGRCAAECFEESALVLENAKIQEELARTFRAHAVHKISKGEPEEGRVLAKKARSIFVQLEMPAEIRRTDDALARLS